ncbi:MAG: hypothetical protein KH703_09820 [Campylobacter gracilis]|uniref:hypothetical protein n=1 Tax=Campylobacter gracilis TaxID=824 RepID=UPI0026F0761B|nr:hypothetical protein [Campylobacter gracilis]MBS6153666.1 hypothetical protein [Campylobacter gracilis]
MKNKATLKFKNFTARPRSFWVHTKLARAGAALCYSRPTEAVCLERPSTVAKSSGVGKNFKSQNLKSLNFKNRNATGTDFDADRNIRLGAGHDINFRPDRAVNFKISNANLKADLARPKASFR